MNHIWKYHVRLTGLVLCLALLLCLPPGTQANAPGPPDGSYTPTEPAAPDQIANLDPGDIGWMPGFTLNGPNIIIFAMAWDESSLYIGGRFDSAGDARASNIVAWDGSRWKALCEGIQGDVLALTSDGQGNLYAGGSFSSASGMPAQNITRWNGSAWEALGGGLNGPVRALALDKAGNLYAGGMFWTASGVVNSVARWDGSQWYALGDGVTDPPSGYYPEVFALAVDPDDNLYAGGRFTQAGGESANHIARWDGSVWEPLGLGMQGKPSYSVSVRALTFDESGGLYAAGSFNTAGGIEVNHIARWDGSEWEPLGGGVTTQEYPRATINALAASDDMLYAAGVFDTAGGVTANGLAAWDGEAWLSLGGELQRRPYAPYIQALSLSTESILYAGGQFSLAGETNAQNIARWDGEGWSGLGPAHSVNNAIIDLAFDTVSGNTYAVGYFDAAADEIVNHVASWDGVGWAPLGAGLDSSEPGALYAQAVAVGPDGEAYVGGYFDAAGGVPAHNVARWDGQSWEPLGEGVNGVVSDLAVDSQGHLYAGGSFNIDGPRQIQYLAKWNGEVWESLGFEFMSSIQALAIDSDDNLYVSSYFYRDGKHVHLWKWDGAVWAPLTGLSNPPLAIAVDEKNLYITDWYGVQRWSGYGWEQIASLPGVGRALALDNQGNLYLGGYFQWIRDRNSFWQIGNLARWDGSNWQAFGNGVNNTVYALQIDSQGQLLVGGAFSLAGGQVSNYFGVWEQPLFTYFPLIQR